MNWTLSKMDWLLVGIAAVALTVFLIRRWAPEQFPGRSDKQLLVGDLIEQLRVELHDIDKRRIESGQGALFRIEQAEVEVSFVAKETTQADGKAQLQVVTVGASRSIGTEKVQRLKVLLKTLPPEDGSAAPEDGWGDAAKDDTTE